MPGKNTANWILPLAIFITSILPVTLNGQQACGKSLNELKIWIQAEPQLSQQTLTLPYPVFAKTPDPINFTKDAGLYPRYFFLESSAPQAFFCRIEHQLAQKIQVPIKFRLGSVQYVDWLKGKPGAGIFPY